MKAKIIPTLLVLAAAVSGFAQRGFPKEYVSDEVLVKFRPGMEASADIANALLGVTQIGEIPQIGWKHYRLPEGVSVVKAVKYYRGLACVEQAEPNGIVHAAFTPNDTNWGSQYGPVQVKCPTAWDIQQGSTGVTIAIIDTGIQLNHPDLDAKITNAGRDFANNDMNASDDNGHGTHCAGISAAETNNAQGVAGVSFNCRLYPVKVLNSGGSGTWANVASGITWAADQYSTFNVRVLSLSLGGTNDGGVTQSAVDYAWNKGCVVVCAAGNNASSSPFYPAWYANAIAVAATNSSDVRDTSYSNFGSWVDIAAPGTNVFSTYLGSTYTSLTGTSMACPHVAGAAALVFSHYGANSTPAFVRKRLERTADKWGTYGITGGRLNVHRAIAEIWPTTETIVFGTGLSGNLDSLINADDDRRVYRNGATFLITQSPITVQYSGNCSFTGVTKFEVNFEGHASTPGLTQRVDVFNTSTGTYQNVDTRTATTTDSAFTYTQTTNISNYIHPTTGLVRWQYRLKDDTPAVVAVWEGRVDRCDILPYK
jgi:thermitase